jgi:hypothetical protein
MYHYYYYHFFYHLSPLPYVVLQQPSVQCISDSA